MKASFCRMRLWWHWCPHRRGTWRPWGHWGSLHSKGRWTRRTGRSSAVAGWRHGGRRASHTWRHRGTWDTERVTWCDQIKENVRKHHCTLIRIQVELLREIMEHHDQLRIKLGVIRTFYHKVQKLGLFRSQITRKDKEWTNSNSEKHHTSEMDMMPLGVDRVKGFWDFTFKLTRFQCKNGYIFTRTQYKHWKYD